MFMRQLNYLAALDKHRHFARAAESCHVSQPALSAGLSELERELGITIIKRTRSFEGITPEGERVLAWARQVLNSLDGLRQEAELLETVCKYIPDEAGDTYADDAVLPKLWQMTAERLNLAPHQHQEPVFKAILGNCQSVVNYLGSIRNKI